MKPSIIHTIIICLTTLVVPFMAACGSQEESLPPQASPEARMYLNVETIGGSRGGADKLSENEMMHSLRVILLHADGKVEHNRFYPLEGPQAQKDILMKVRPGEKKKVFLFANEESVSEVEGKAGVGVSLTSFLNSYTEGTTGFEEAVNSLYFRPEYTDGKNIPMSSVYEVDFPEKGNWDGKFYVVRVATKFCVNFFNKRTDDVVVEYFSIASHADNNFLMAHVGGFPASADNPDWTWIDWLKAVSDASNENSEAATAKYGWLTDYELPETEANTSVYTYSGPLTVGRQITDADHPESAKPGVADIIPVFYLPESKNLKGGEQEYTVTIKIAGREEPFVRTLPNLKALFRNTHVVVNVTMTHKLDLEVDVIPYSEVTLDPIFGLDPVKDK